MKVGRRAKAFSLVELVIVVVIIGVIAAIAVPRISRGAKGAAVSALRADLASLRNSIDMYAAEHGGTFAATDGLEATLIDQLTKNTDANGNVGTTAGVHIYGPYLRGGFPPLPVGPSSGLNPVGVIISITATLTVDELQTDKGWLYSSKTGEVKANTDDTDEGGVVTYDTY